MPTEHDVQFPKQRQNNTVSSTPSNGKQFPMSPVPPASAQVNKKPEEMNFTKALEKVLEGRRITRLSWETNDTFGQIQNDQLHLFINGEFHSWTLVPGDITAEDWIVLPEQGK